MVSVKVPTNNCPKDMTRCRDFQWELTANLTDGNGVGIEKISLRHGDGTLTHTSLSDRVVQADYKASCCAQAVDLTVTDKAGNVGKCYHSIVPSASPPALTQSLPLCLLASSFTGRLLSG